MEKNLCEKKIKERLNYGVDIKRYEEEIDKPGGSPRVQGEEWE